MQKRNSDVVHLQVDHSNVSIRRDHKLQEVAPVLTDICMWSFYLRLQQSVCRRYWGLSGRSRNRNVHALHGNGPGPRADAESLHLFRRRPTLAAREVLVEAVGASHIVGDDVLCPYNKRDSPMEAAMFKFGKNSRWG